MYRIAYQVYSEPVMIENTEYQGTVKIICMWTHYDKVR